MVEYSSKDSSLLYMKQIQEEGERTDAPSWVYYKKLEETNSSFYSLVKNRLSNFNNQKLKIDTKNKLRKMVDRELAKEKNLLKRVFGNNAVETVNWEDPAEIKIFIEQIQDMLRFRGITDRAEKRLQEKTASISIAPYFTSYFNKVFENFLKTKATEYFENEDLNPTSFENYINKHLPELLKETLKETLTSYNLNRKTDSGQGYLELFEEIKDTPLADKFLDVLRKTYKIDETMSSFSKNFEKGKNGKERMKEGFREKTGKGERTRTKAFVKLSYIKGGSLQEHLAELYMNAFAKKQFKNKDFDFIMETAAVGEVKARVDIITSVDLSNTIQSYEKLLNSMQDNSREEARIATKKIIEQLKEETSGFFIYTNAKNYQLGNSFEGFSGGSTMKLQQYFNLLSEVQDVNKLSQFVTAIMNTLEGAIGEESKENLESLLSQDVAYFLFDDFETIADENTSGAQSIHLFLLSDFYVPLSLFLRLLATCFEDIEENGNKYAEFTIYTKEIAYPNGPWGIEKWQSQRNKALTETEIGLKFLSSFKETMENILF